MKRHTLPLIGSGFAAAVFAALFAAAASAGPHGLGAGGDRYPGSDGNGPNGPGLRGLGNIDELVAKRDEFIAFRRLNFEGLGFYTKQDELIGLHSRIYHGIEEATVTSSLDQTKANGFVDQLLAIGNKAKTLRGGADKLNDADSASIRQSLETLHASVRAATANQVNPDTLSPRIDHLIWTMNELYRFAISGGTSAGRAAVIRRHTDDLQRKEASYKADGKLSERERESLLKAAREAWKACIRAII